MGKKSRKKDEEADWENDATAIAEEQAAASQTAPELLDQGTAEAAVAEAATKEDSEQIPDEDGASNATRRGMDTGGGFESVRSAYEELGASGFYEAHGAEYTNPHEP
eukprot:1987818-Prymnesium_polylepis.1